MLYIQAVTERGNARANQNVCRFLFAPYSSFKDPELLIYSAVAVIGNSKIPTSAKFAIMCMRTVAKLRIK